MGVKTALSSLSIIVLFATGCELEQVERDPAAQEVAAALESSSAEGVGEQSQPSADSEGESTPATTEQTDGESSTDSSDPQADEGESDSGSDSGVGTPALSSPAEPASGQPDSTKPDSTQPASGQPESARPGNGGQSATPGSTPDSLPDIPRPVLPAPEEIPKQPDRPVSPAPPDNDPPAPDPRPDPPAPEPDPEPDPPAPQPDPPAPQPDPPAPNPPAPLPDGNLRFSEDFTGGDWKSRIAFGLYHRDDSLVNTTQWGGDHQSTGPNDMCGSPDEKRIVQRGERATGFNDEWIYRCVPGGDLGKAHMMTTIGATSGYSIGGFAPNATFNNVTEVRWDVNQTDLGARQFTEITIIPAGRFDFQNLPCTSDVPCDTTSHDALGSVGTSWTGHRARKINTFDEPDGYVQAGGALGYRCDGCPYAPSRKFGEAYGVDDPALTSIRIRRQNFFRDNGDGTLTWGFQLDDGSFDLFTAPGSFPRGDVRVVFKDHNYTPQKSPPTLLPVMTFTWHWDNIQVYAS